MHKSTLIRESTVGADEDVVCDGLSEDFHLQHVRDDLLRLTVDVRVHKRNVVVACDDISQRGETLFDALDGDLIGQ